MRRGRFEVAEQHLREALEQYPEDVMLRKLLIETLVYQSRFDTASSELAALPPAVQEEAPVLLLRGRLAMVAQDFAQAEGLLARAHDLQPSTSTVAFLAGAVWASGDRQESVDLLETWLEGNPEDSAIRLQLASRQLELGNNDRARQLYRSVLDSQPNSVVALNNLAWLSRIDDPEAALAYIQRADDLLPNSSQIMDTYAMVLMAAGDVEEALAMNAQRRKGPQVTRTSSTTGRKSLFRLVARATRRHCWRNWLPDRYLRLRKMLANFWSHCSSSCTRGVTGASLAASMPGCRTLRVFFDHLSSTHTGFSRRCFSYCPSQSMA
jgi:tetratricopeptide (TPR) repeat protein